MKKPQIAFLLLFSVLLALPVLTMNTEKDVASEITNAKLAEWPEEDAEPWQIDAYLEDRIGFYEPAIHGYMVLNDRLFSKMVHPNYSYGKDGVLFMNFEEERVDHEFIQLFARYLRHVQDTSAARGIPFIYCINPAKSTVYSEYLPEGYHYSNEFLPTLYEALEENGVNYISTVELLTEKAKTEAVFNRQFDPGHWNDLGQFYATNHLLEKVGTYFPSVGPWDFDDFRFETQTIDVLGLSQFRIDEEVPKFHFKGDVEITTSAYDDVVIDERHRHFQTYRRADDGDGRPTALFFHGSYYNKSADFYQGAFSEIYTVHNYQNLLRFEYFLDRFEPDVLMLETAEYATVSNYFDMEEMKRQLGE